MPPLLPTPLCTTTAIANSGSDDLLWVASPPWCNSSDLAERSPVEGHFSAGTVAFLAFLHIFGLVAFVGNCLVIYLFATAEIRQKNIYYYFVINLSVSDMLVGLAFPFALASIYAPALRTYAHCALSLCVLGVLVMVSLSQMFVISLDQYAAVRCPHGHRRLVNAFRAKVAIALVWLYSAAVGVLPFAVWARDDTAGAPTTCHVGAVFPGDATRMYFGSTSVGYTPLFLLTGYFCLALLASVSRRTGQMHGSAGSRWNRARQQQQQQSHHQQEKQQQQQQLASALTPGAGSRPAGLCRGGSAKRKGSGVSVTSETSKRAARPEREHSSSSTFEMSSADTERTAQSSEDAAAAAAAAAAASGAASASDARADEEVKADALKPGGGGGGLSGGGASGCGRRGTSGRGRTYRRAAVTLSIVAAFFLVCLTPSLLLALYNSARDATRFSAGRMVASVLVCVNSAVNPLIYALRMNKLRERLYACCLRRGQRSRRGLDSVEDERSPSS
ncbi:uncharacterized protein LOC116937103 [Petromyzon marinus]|uniref:uncharacterized protein LOC116937103 n=1 Tax=Petromyzon marinus TaxID=7757 RepID=UPI003F703A5A